MLPQLWCASCGKSHLDEESPLSRGLYMYVRFRDFDARSDPRFRADLKRRSYR